MATKKTSYTYKEPKEYFNADMRKAIDEYKRKTSTGDNQQIIKNGKKKATNKRNTTK